MAHKHMFDTIGIPRPGTGNNQANQTNVIFIKLAGPQLAQIFIGDGAKLIRDAFELAKEKIENGTSAILFIDEIDVIGTKRYGEGPERWSVQRTMLELLSQLDGFSSNDMIKVNAATNRPDVLDPAV